MICDCCLAEGPAGLEAAWNKRPLEEGLIWALEAAEAYEAIRETSSLSDEYHTLIAPWRGAIEDNVGDEFPPNERFPGWHRDGLRLMVGKLRRDALAKVLNRTP